MYPKVFISVINPPKRNSAPLSLSSRNLTILVDIQSKTEATKSTLRTSSAKITCKASPDITSFQSIALLFLLRRKQIPNKNVTPKIPLKRPFKEKR